MNVFGWFLGGAGAALLTGLVFLAFGLWPPGQAIWPETTGGAGPSLLLEARKKSESVRQSREQVEKETKAISGFRGTEGEHRVFVSRTLVYLPKDPGMPEPYEPVQPLDRKIVTGDLIEVGWKIDYGFDPFDPAVAGADPDGDGFTTFEEFNAQPRTDPTNKEDSPAKESKLRSRSGEEVRMAVSFSERSGGVVTVRFEVPGQTTASGVGLTKIGEFKGKPGESFWVMAGPGAVEVFAQESKMTAARLRAKQAGKNSHVIPLKISSYEEKIGEVELAKTGGVKADEDFSFIVLERNDAAGASVRLVISPATRPRTTFWDVGEVRFHAPGSGGTELGPYRVGETFRYEGKEFAIRGRDGKKIRLQNLSESGKEPFWVFPEAEIVRLPAQP